jgi:hypothetical protein
MMAHSKFLQPGTERGREKKEEGLNEGTFPLAWKKLERKKLFMTGASAFSMHNNMKTEKNRLTDNCKNAIKQL